MQQLSNYEKNIRPWGNSKRFTLNEATTVKIIFVSPTEAFSLQTHKHRAEFWRILKGSGTITVGNSTVVAQEGDEFYIEKETHHRAEAGTQGLEFLEIAFGEFDEQDITRLEDKYGRI